MADDLRADLKADVERDFHEAGWLSLRNILTAWAMRVQRAEEAHATANRNTEQAMHQAKRWHENFDRMATLSQKHQDERDEAREDTTRWRALNVEVMRHDGMMTEMFNRAIAERDDARREAEIQRDARQPKWSESAMWVPAMNLTIEEWRGRCPLSWEHPDGSEAPIRDVAPGATGVAGHRFDMDARGDCHVCGEGPHTDTSDAPIRDACPNAECPLPHGHDSLCPEPVTREEFAALRDLAVQCADWIVMVGYDGDTKQLRALAARVREAK